MTSIEQRAVPLTAEGYLHLLRSSWLSLLALILLGVVSAFCWTVVQPRVYSANSSGIVSMRSESTLGGEIVADSLAKSKATTYVGVARSRAVAERVVKALHLTVTPDSLITNITASAVTNTPTIGITALASTPTGSQELADAWIAALATEIAEIESRMSGGHVGSIFLEPIESAAVPQTPVSPNVKVSLLLGGVVGLLIGFGLAALRNQLDRRIRTPEAVERLFGLSVIGRLPRDKNLSATDRIVIPVTIGASRVSNGPSHGELIEAFRELRTNIQFVNIDEPPRVIVVTSALPGEGKSTVVANLAMTFAMAGVRTVVVDGDLRRPSVAAIFGVLTGVGVTDLLIGRAELDDVVQEWGPSGMISVLGAGSIPPNPSELLGSQGMNSLLRHLAETAIVIVDAPPLLPVTDAAVLSARADGVIFVIAAGRTTIEEANLAVGGIARAGGNIMGVVLNGVSGVKSRKDGYGYYSGVNDVAAQARRDAASV